MTPCNGRTTQTSAPLPVSLSRGARFVDDVAGIAVTSDRATATVVYHFEKAPDDKTNSVMTFVRENGRWTVCSPGPR